MNLTGSIRVWAGFVPFSNLYRKICFLIFSSFGGVPALLTLWSLSSEPSILGGVSHVSVSCSQIHFVRTLIIWGPPRESSASLVP